MRVYEYLSMVSSFISAVIAFAAVLFTRKELREYRNYNKLSIRPLLVIRLHLGGSQGKYGISVTNEGLGPALIKDLVVIIGHEKMKDLNDHGWNAAIEKLKLHDIASLFKFEVIAPCGVISHGDRKWLFYLNKDDANKSSDEKNRKRLENGIKHFDFDVRISYQSMFDDPYKISLSNCNNWEALI